MAKRKGYWGNRPYGLRIDVLSIGCTRCGQLKNDVCDLLSEIKIAANLRFIIDPKEISHYRLLGSPALVIKNKVSSIGEVPPKSKIRPYLIESYNSINKYFLILKLSAASNGDSSILEEPYLSIFTRSLQ